MALTKVTGSVIKDSVSLSGNVSVGGTLTYQDVTNVDALGIGTFRTGINVSGGQIDVGSNIKLGNAGVVTATTFSGSGASLTNLPAGNLTGTVADARISTLTASKLTGALPAISGANLTNLPTQVTITSNADDRVITGGSGVNLNGESTMTYTSSLLKLATASSTSTDAELLHLVGGGTSNRGLKISTGRASGASQNHGAAIYDAINSESGGYGSQHRFKIAGTDCFTIGYNGDFGFVGINDNVPYPDSIGGSTVKTCLELGSPSGTDTASVIKFNGRDGSSNLNKCQIQWSGAHNRFDITVNGNQALQIQANKDVEVTDGDLVIGTAGHGINFSATGDASGSTSELLDDYEEGSWTPYIYPMSSAIPVTYSHQSGRYQKIGNVVHFQFKVQVSNITGNRNQGFGISGFPYNNTGSQDYQTTGQFFGVTWDGEMPTTLVFTPNTTRGVCYYYADAMKYYSSSMLDINVNNSMLSGSGHYFTHV